MDQQELKTAKYLTEESLTAVPPQQPMGTSQRELLGCAGMMVAFVAAFMMFFGHFGVLFSCSDLYQIPVMTDEYVSSPISPLVSSASGLWRFFVISLAVFVLGSVGVGSLPANGAISVLYIMCPIVAVACFVGWPLRQRSFLRVWLAAIYAGVGVALTWYGWNGYESTVQKLGNSELLPFTFACQAGLSLAAGGFLALVIDFQKPAVEA